MTVKFEAFGLSEWIGIKSNFKLFPDAYSRSVGSDEYKIFEKREWNKQAFLVSRKSSNNNR